MNLVTVAKQMAHKYNEEELKWVLVLKRLERNGYTLIRKNDIQTERNTQNEKNNT